MRIKGLFIAGAATAALVVAGCGSSSSTTSTNTGTSTGSTSSATTSATTSSTPSSGGAVLGTPNPAKGTPVLFGAINNETNQGADFPESREAANAMVDYVNEYKGGLDGHPIKIDWCITDGTPATSSSCASKLIAAKPVAIIGSTDLADSVTLPAYQKAGLAYIGGMNFTPVESSAKNSVIFNDTAQLGNVLAAMYAVKELHAKKVAIIALGDTQGEFTADKEWVPAVTAAGGTSKVFPAPPTQADLSSVIEAAISWGPDVIGLESPSQCVALLDGLKSAGWTKPVVSIDTCSAPVTLKATAGAAEGMYWFQPFQLLNTGTADAKLAAAILAKYAPSNIAVDSPSLTMLNTIYNVWDAFHSTPVASLNSAYMLKTLRTGADHANFLAEPYTCNGSAIPAYSAICNSKYYLYQVSKSNQAERVGTQTWSMGASIFGK